MSLFDGLFGGGSGYQDAAQAEIQGLQQGYNQASGLYGQGRGDISNYGAAGLAPYTNVFNTGTQGVNMYGNAMGLGGPSGNAAALAGFQNNPGYQFQLGQGEQAIERANNVGGLLPSGNTAAAEAQYATGLANQGWQNYVSNLAPYFNQQNTGAAGIAQGNQYIGTGLNASLGNQGNLAFNTQAGIGNAQGAADIAQQKAQDSFLQGAMGMGTKLLGYAAMA